MDMEKAKATPKDFFLWAGAMVALYGGVIAFISLLFQYINYAFPNTLSYYNDPYQGGVAYAMASLIVLAPVFLILMRTIRRSIERDESRSEVWVRRWALFLTVFIAGVTIVIDLIVLLTTFLSGEELTASFLLKVAVVLLVAAAGFMHFLADIWGYWVKNPSYARYINWATGLLVVLTILSGFLIVGSPQEARMYRLDAQRVSDLQSLQYQVLYVYQQTEALPQSLAALNDPLSYYTVPLDPKTGEAYEYRATGVRSFELCATFDLASRVAPSGYTTPARPGAAEENWMHAAGTHCFERIIDPALYPPFSKNI